MPASQPETELKPKTGVMVHRTLKLSRADADELDRRAAVLGLSRSELHRLALRRYFANGNGSR
jgi:hypothetical protein